MEFPLPELGEGVYEAELVRWLVQPGGLVKRGQVLLEVMTDKATMEVPSPFAGTMGELKAQPGRASKIGEVILTYLPAQANNQAPEIVPAAPSLAHAVPSGPRHLNGPVPSGTGQSRLPVKAAPSVRHLARKLGIDLGAVRGTGPEGRVLLDDVGGQFQTKDARSGAGQ